MTKLYIVRHGQTDWNVAGRIQGHHNSQLTDEGLSQAHRLKERLADTHFDAIYASDLHRAHETAMIISEGRSKDLVASPHFRERSQGSIEGSYREAAREQYPDMYALWDTADDQTKMNIKIVPDAESMQESADRFTLQLTRIVNEYPGSCILIVTHGAVMRAFLYHVGLAKLSQVEHIDNTGYLVIESDGQIFSLTEAHGVRGIDEQGLDKSPKIG